MRYTDYVVTVAPEGAAFRAVISRADGRPIVCEDTERLNFQTMKCQTEDLARRHAKAAIDGGLLTLR